MMKEEEVKKKQPKSKMEPQSENSHLLRFEDIQDIEACYKNQWEVQNQFNSDYIRNVVEYLYELKYDLLD